MLKEYPMPFSFEMVQAIESGRKTQTRRILKNNLPVEFKDWIPTLVNEGHRDGIPRYEWRSGTKYLVQTFRCPYGKVGDLIWVREKHFLSCHPDNWIAIEFEDGTKHTHYYKNLSLNLVNKIKARKSVNRSWVPALFLPKELARIWMQIEDIRVERLHEISSLDAIAEGILKTWHSDQDPIFCRYKNYINDGKGSLLPCQSYRSLWKSIYGNESFDSNPWVWVITFKVLSTTGRPAIEESEVANA